MKTDATIRAGKDSQITTEQKTDREGGTVEDLEMNSEDLSVVALFPFRSKR
jgi:hypothetical protein